MAYQEDDDSEDEELELNTKHTGRQKKKIFNPQSQKPFSDNVPLSQLSPI